MVTPLQVFSTTTKSPSSSSTLNYMKIKTLIHTLIISHVCRIIRAISKTKSIIIQLCKENQPIKYFIYTTKETKRKQRERKIFFGSFRLHYNWCSSSHVLPVPAAVLEGFKTTSSHSYYDSTWNTIIDVTTNDHDDDQLSGYLHWLEENSKKVKNQENNNEEGDNNNNNIVNEIDKLADLFIANCHEKFLLEKQESYRRFQEMMARSV